MVLFAQGGCFRAKSFYSVKMDVFCKSSCTRVKVVVFGQNGYIRAKVILFGKVVLLGQKWL